MSIFILFLVIETAITSCQSGLNPGSTETPLPNTPGMESTPIVAKITLFPLETPTVFIIAVPKATLIIDPAVEPLILLAKEDLSQRNGIDPDKIIVLEADAVEWPDGSLGCGQPSSFYIQVVTPGYELFLEADGQIYSYHTNMSNLVVLCNPQPPLSLTPQP